MWFTRLAIARPILIWMVLAAIALLGLQAYFRLPAELIPALDIPTLTVTTIYPGAGPPEDGNADQQASENGRGACRASRNVCQSQSSVSILSMDFQRRHRISTWLRRMCAGVSRLSRGNLPPGANMPLIAKLDINAQPVYYFGLSAPSPIRTAVARIGRQRFAAPFAARTGRGECTGAGRRAARNPCGRGRPPTGRNNSQSKTL